MYVTYTDGRFAYEALAQLNNHHLENYDLNLHIKVENEQVYSKLFEQELMDCLMSVYYARHISLSFGDKENGPMTE